MKNKIKFSCVFLLFFSVNTSVYSQSLADIETECTAPEGYVCGSKKGTIYETVIISGPNGTTITTTKKDCCVSSTASMACNVSSVGCSDIREK